METQDRDVFIVHTKSDDRESALVEALVPRLHEVNIPTWLYDDWSWEHRVRRTGRGAPRASGRLEELDYPKYLAGDPMPFRAPVDEVDEGTLAQMIHGSRVVLLCEPINGGPSSGVALERKVMAGLSPGPILLHLLWPDSGGEFFDRLRPTTRLKVSHDTVNEAAVHEVFAAVASAWLVHNMQKKFGRQGGHKLLKIVAGRDAALAEQVENSPHYREPEEPDKDAKPPEKGSIAELFARMAPLEAKLFEKWWTGDAAALRSKAAEGGSGTAATGLRDLATGIDQHWRDVIG